ncbi:hypothetical protein [Polynucleobacter kasalickyi]|uniref:Uncharacterized protein n=1 Tax=Polynucleobacter kasalickyi TaxID=1938817 RepID=A0A1W1YAS6_9BURK|nr:hypothetical protein [Polynucleobacter kasalickyi]SMC33265.1 hypothetical protein SAMN06296008_102189 [Polynucleobacter kasalickyi]
MDFIHFNQKQLAVRWQVAEATFELLLDSVLSDIGIHFSDKTVIPAQKH